MTPPFSKASNKSLNPNIAQSSQQAASPKRRKTSSKRKRSPSTDSGSVTVIDQNTAGGSADLAPPVRKRVTRGEGQFSASPITFTYL